MFYGGDAAGAEAPYREQRDILRDLAGAHPQDVYLSRRLARAGWALGSTLLEIGRAAEGASILDEARVRLAQLLLLEPEDSDLARSLDITEDAYASGLVALHRYPEALKMLERSTTTRARLADADANNASLRRDYAIGLTALGDALARSGRQRVACARYIEALAEFDKVRALGRLPELDSDFNLQRLRQSKEANCR
jgi:tetratricopeptide (TPR) repeat protein